MGRGGGGDGKPKGGGKCVFKMKKEGKPEEDKVTKEKEGGKKVGWRG